MSRERIGAGKRVPTGPYHDHEDRLNDLWAEWVNLVLELKLDGLVRCQFPEHLSGTNSPNIESRFLCCLRTLRRICGRILDAIALLHSTIWFPVRMLE